MFCEPKRLQRSGGGREAEVKSERETKKKKGVCAYRSASVSCVCACVCDGGEVADRWMYQEIERQALSALLRDFTALC